MEQKAEDSSSNVDVTLGNFCFNGQMDWEQQQNGFIGGGTRVGVLKSLGLVDVSGSSGGCNTYTDANWLVVTGLTAEGINASKGWKKGAEFAGQTTWRIPLATLKVLEVTGISKEGQTATVEFRWEWSYSRIGTEMNRLNPSMTPGGQRNGTAEFRLYDDGWKFVNWSPRY